MYQGEEEGGRKTIVGSAYKPHSIPNVFGYEFPTAYMKFEQPRRA